MKRFLAVLLSITLILLSFADGMIAFATTEHNASNDDVGDLYGFASALVKMIRTNDKDNSDISSDYIPVDDDGKTDADEITEKFPITYTQTSNDVAEFYRDNISVTVTDGSNVVTVDDGENVYKIETEAPATVKNGEVSVSADEIMTALEFGASEYRLVPHCFDSKRLIVKSSKEFDHYGAVECVSGYKNLHILQYNDPLKTREAYYKLLENDNIDYVEPDVTREMQSKDAKDILGDSDEYFYEVRENALSWVSKNIGFEDLKDELAQRVLADVVVAVIDSGVDTDHEHLEGRLQLTNINLSSSGEPNSCEDDYGHGTHVAGIVADNTLSNVKIRPYKVLNNQGKCPTSLMAIAIDLAVADGVDVINISISAEGDNQMLTDAVNEATNKGVNVVVSAGNDNTDLSKNHYSPASIESAITVSAVNDKGQLSYYSNYNGTIDIAAPGDDVKSSYLYNTYKLMSGTSMAAPAVAAGLAIVHSVYPEKSGAEVEEMIKKYAVKVEELKGENKYGAGLLYVKYILDKLPKTAPVDFSVQSGSFNNSFKLTLSCTEKDATIFYVINPKDDNIDIGYSNGTKYTDPITISVDTKILAVAIVKGKMFSEVRKCTYTRVSGSVENLYDIDNTGMITGYVGTEVDLVVPDTIRGITVRGVAMNAFKDNDRIHSITLPATATRIGSTAFYECGSLYSVTGAGLKRVDSSAFENSTITEFPFEQLEKVGSKAFSGCNNLINVNLKNITSIEASAFENANTITELNSEKVQSIGKYAFRNTKIMNVNIPSVGTISMGAFEQCPNLDNVSAKNALSIGNYAFRNCISLRNIDFPAVMSLGAEAFVNTAIENITMPFVTSIGQKCFSGCTALKSAVFEKAKTVESYAFINCKNLKFVYLPELTLLNTGTFSGCEKLKSLWLPNVATVNTNGFANSFVEFVQFDNAVSIKDLPNTLKGVVLSSSLQLVGDVPTTDYVVYGYKDSYAETYANKNSKEFQEVPAVVYSTSEQATVEDKYIYTYALGFDCKYQWYKNDKASTEGGTPIEGANNFYYEPKREDNAVVYYCVITSNDGQQSSVTVSPIIYNAPEYREADYTEYFAYLETLKDIDRSIYTEASLANLDSLVSKDISGLSLAEQNKIKEHIDKIKDAVENLVVKYVLGDIDDDGEITVIDARMALTFASGKTTLNEIQLLAADVNKDGEVNVIDARILLRVAAQLESLIQ